jgi:hypothetical protein
MAEELTVVTGASPANKLMRCGESAAHARLKRLACIWAQAHGYSACAVEVSLPRCRYRADVAAFRVHRDGDRAAIFECKQALADLRRDNCDSASARERLDLVQARRTVIERNLRLHYPTLRTGESLFPDYDAWDFDQAHHRGYSCILRHGAMLQQRLIGCTKFEKLARYHCANLCYLVIAEPLHSVAFEMPRGWGLLVETGNALRLMQKPQWHGISPEARLQFLRRVAAAATRALNRELAITRDEIEAVRESI